MTLEELYRLRVALEKIANYPGGGDISKAYANGQIKIIDMWITQLGNEEAERVRFNNRVPY